MTSGEFDWHEEGRRTLHRHRLFHLYESNRRKANGTQASFVMLEAPEWVNIAALTQNEQGEDCLVLVRQFRFGINRTALEFPGGVVEPGESVLAGAVRELLEETGFTADHWEHLGSANPNAAFMTNLTHAYLATGLRSVAGLNLDEHEELEVSLVPLRELTPERQPDFFLNGIMLLTWHWFLARRQA